MIKIEYDEHRKLIRKIYTFDEWDRENGPFRVCHENGILWEKGNYKKGRLDGFYELYFSNGHLGRRCFYQDGVRNGIYERYFKNGSLEIRCHYLKGQRQGPYETYYPNGRLSERGYYESGDLEGPYESYDQKGTIRNKGIMHRGKYKKHHLSEIEKSKKILRKELHRINTELPPDTTRQKIKRELVAQFRKEYPKSPLLYKLSQELSR